MSDNCENIRDSSEEDNDQMHGVHFINLEEIMDIFEEQQQREEQEFRDSSEEDNHQMRGVHIINLERIREISEEQQQREEQEFDEREEVKRRIMELEKAYKQKREVFEQQFQLGQELEAEMNKIAAENKDFTNTEKEYQQKAESRRKLREREDVETQERHQELMSEEESRTRRSYMKEVEDETRCLRKQKEEKTAEPKLEQVQEELQRKDAEVDTISWTLIQNNNQIGERLSTIEDLRREQQELQEKLKKRQQKQILAAEKAPATKRHWSSALDLFFQEQRELREKLNKLKPILSAQKASSTSTVRLKHGSSAMDVKDERHPKNDNWQRCLIFLWKGVKVAGYITFCVLLPVEIIASMAPDCNLPAHDCDLYNVVYHLLDSYCPHHASPVY
ncbi:Peripheral-type benzodiazepine receptor-associated protein 1 [Dissostichus eleginoides]|uniref:Peripheral-type benzodiazepine receptor-associated protein 1 n=1 Tax=Dissostichus eleginoides TaxID=100907 RepID=A0AAD9C693_DISEL|nr:Peripheral-type benzodiazepine receptor-associated protein 1 [Dissostichus eleginoides]